MVLGPGFNAQPQWLPDGATIVYRDGPRIMTVGLDGNASREIASVPRLRTIEVSPDGRTIAYIVDPAQGTAGRASLWIVPTAGGAARELLPASEGGTGTNVRGLTWARDGGSVLVARNSDARWYLWQIHVDGRAPRRLEMDTNAWPADAFDTRFTLSPDGSTLAFLYWQQRGRGLGARRRPVRDPRAAMMSWRSRAPTP